MATRSRDYCGTTCRREGWFWTVPRVISLSLLTFLKVSANDGTTTCSIPSVEPLQDTILTCHFPEDLTLTKKDFTIYHYVEKNNPDAVVDCWWLSGTLDCFSKHGFSFDKTVSTHLSATATRVSYEHEGFYACQVAGYGPSSLGTCEFQLKFGENNTCNIAPVKPNSQTNLTCYFNEDVRKTQSNFTVYRHTGEDEQNPVLNCWWDGQEPKCWVESGYQILPHVSSYLILSLPNGDSNYSCGHANSNHLDKEMCQMIKDKGKTEETTQTVVIIVAIIVSVVVLTILVIFLVIFLKRRRSAINRGREDDEELQGMLGWSKAKTSKRNKPKDKKDVQLITQQFSDYLLKSVKDMFPDITEGCFFVPPVYFNTTRYTTTMVADQVANIPESSDESVVTHDEAVQRVLFCLRHWAEHRRENMFLVTQFKYEDYLNGDQDFSGHTLPKPTDLDEKNQAIKCFDFMIIHRHHGIVVGVVVDVVEYDDDSKREENEKAILSHLSDAIRQLKTAERVVSHVVSDVSQFPSVRKTLMFPNLSLSSLQRALKIDAGFAEELRMSFNTKIIEKSASEVGKDSLQRLQTLKHSVDSITNLKEDHANKESDDSATTVRDDHIPKHFKDVLKRRSGNSIDKTSRNSNTLSGEETTSDCNMEKGSETSEGRSAERVQSPANEAATDTTDEHREHSDHDDHLKNTVTKVEVVTKETPINATTEMYDASITKRSNNSIAKISNDAIGKTSDDPINKTLDNPTDPVRVCLCSDHLSDPQNPSDVTPTVLQDLEQWWSLLTSSNSYDIRMTDDLYLKVISRVCGPATSPTFLIPGYSEPVLLPRTLDQAVSFTGELFERLTLYSDMTELLKEPRLFLCGPPGTEKTTMLMLAGKSWLLEGHDVYILKTSESSTESRGKETLKMEKSTRKFGDGSRGNVFVYCTNINDKKSRKKAIKEILKHSTPQPAHIIADELEYDREEVKQLMETFLKINNNQNCMWITRSHGCKVPAGWREEFLTTALRCPPAVVREASTIITQHFPDVRPYSPPDFPAPTDGPPVKYIYHAGEEHAKGQPRDCEQCASEVANFLTRIIHTSESDSEEGTSEVTMKASQGVGRQFSLHARDVMILFESEVDHTKTIMLKKIIETGIFVEDTTALSAGESDIRLAGEASLLFGEKGKVVVKKVIKPGICFEVTVTPDISTDKSDIALVGEASLLRGEKRKVVVYVEDNVDNSDIWWTRLNGITSCYSQLIRVTNVKSVHKA